MLRPLPEALARKRDGEEETGVLQEAAALQEGGTGEDRVAGRTGWALDGRDTTGSADKAAKPTKEFLFSQSNHDRDTLQLVEEALQRIQEGHFGECVHCGGEMQQKRLEAVPWARHCIPCQEKQEQGLL